jgi:membrane protease YdiL (CAAX protease family)
MKARSNIFNTNLIYFIILTLFVGIRICASLNLFNFLGDYQGSVLSVVLQVGILFLLPLFLISKLNKKSVKQTFSDFNFRSIDFKTVLISILIGFLVFILTAMISTFFSLILSTLGYSSTSNGMGISTWGEFSLYLLVVAILPAVCEEFTHRGLLLSGFKKLGMKKAIIYSSLLFGLLHLNVEQFFYASIIGAVLGAVALFSRSIYPAIIIHFINNGINVYLSFAENAGLPGADLFTRISGFLSGGNIFLTLIFVVLFGILIVYLLFYLISLLLKNNAKESLQNYANTLVLSEMRRQVLGEDQRDEKNQNEKMLFGQNSQGGIMKVKIPYEALGFYMETQVKPSNLEMIFFYGSILLSGLITIFTFVWGVI